MKKLLIFNYGWRVFCQKLSKKLFHIILFRKQTSEKKLLTAPRGDLNCRDKRRGDELSQSKKGNQNES